MPAGEGTVSGADNVPDRPGHRRNRIDIKMAHHVKRGGTSTIEAAADSPAEKARWLLGLRAAMAKKVDAGVLAWLTQIEPTLGVYASFAHFLLRFQVVFSGSDTFLHLHSPFTMCAVTSYFFLTALTCRVQICISRRKI